MYYSNRTSVPSSTSRYQGKGKCSFAKSSVVFTKFQKIAPVCRWFKCKATSQRKEYLCKMHMHTGENSSDYIVF